jgi:thiosulfate/3-mercaptopyruvate sulfurtransferase
MPRKSGSVSSRLPCGANTPRKKLSLHPLVDTKTLAERLAEPDWIIVDCRFRLTQPDAGYSAYQRGHIPGARYAHLDDDLAADPGPGDGRHPLPDPERFAMTLGAWGISNSSLVVVYDDASGAIAARLWWLLRWLGHERVAVLDGGLDAWQADGLPVETTTPTWHAAHYLPATVHDDWVVTSDDLPSLLESGALVLDARSAERFRGIEEPIDPVAGHVPGATNLPYTATLTPSGTLLEPERLRDDLASLLAGRDIADVVAMCGSGVTACHILLALSAAGLGDGRLYAGSWSEWIRSGYRPIATGSD